MLNDFFLVLNQSLPFLDGLANLHLLFDQVFSLSEIVDEVCLLLRSLLSESVMLHYTHLLEVLLFVVYLVLLFNELPPEPLLLLVKREEDLEVPVQFVLLLCMDDLGDFPKLVNFFALLLKVAVGRSLEQVHSQSFVIFELIDTVFDYSLTLLLK